MKRKWFRLDNAALIFPATMGRKWSNAFRVSVTLDEPVDPEILARAAEDIRPRFPVFFVRLRTGFFWYYLEEIRGPIKIRREYAYPLTHMGRKELASSCVRILYFEDRIALEIFHSVTDGTGGRIFLENLTARYLELKHGIEINGFEDVCTPYAEIGRDEEKDCFQIYGGRHPASRKEDAAYRLKGTKEPDGFRRLTTGIVPSEILLRKAHEHKTTVTAFLAAVMSESVNELQRARSPEKRLRPVKITIPVNLRKLYNAYTLRNFALTVNIGFDPRDGEYSFDEICAQMTHQLAAEAVPQKMAGRIAANVDPQKNPVIRLMPLPIKNTVMRAVYARSGEKNGCLNISNLGQIALPCEMAGHIRRFEFIIGVQRTYPNNCSVASFGGNTYINFIRNIKESELERLFFSRLVELGVPVEIESSGRR